MPRECCPAKRPLRHYACVAVAALLGFACVPRVQLSGTLQFMSTAHATERGNFDRLAPKYDSATNTVTFEGKTYVFKKAASIDWDEDGTAETRIYRYEDGANGRVLRLVTKGKTWAWGVYRDYANKQSPRNFALYDLDGHGPVKFETRAKVSEDIKLPSYLK